MGRQDGVDGSVVWAGGWVGGLASGYWQVGGWVGWQVGGWVGWQVGGWVGKWVVWVSELVGANIGEQPETSYTFQ